ncbi:hypothetical protein MMC07_004144 [Pseudocyphellaria aurata]|nr:hypothetical protein [Pseudocyphellaria aurata]
MTDASDIITYVGVPLAVIGVLPIFYTFLNSFLTIRNITSCLRRNGLDNDSATTRGSLLSGVVEVTLPRVSITPLAREDSNYWAPNPRPSSLPGATWTCFNWKALVTGSRLYRLQYSDDLRVPQAEVDLGELLGYLLDRGAVPDVKGLHMLRVSGLWTPTGTSLMLSPDAGQSALRVSVPDDSDGILSLALRWEEAWDNRDPTSLPPSWIRLEIAPPIDIETRNEDTSLVNMASSEQTLPEHGSIKSVDGKLNSKAEAPVIRSEDKVSYLPTPTSLRISLGFLPSAAPTISTATWELSHAPLPNSPSITHLQAAPASSWFPCIALALGLCRSLPLYTHTLPSSLRALSAKDTIPCGVLVLLGLLAEHEAPDWETKYDSFEEAQRQHNSFLAKQRAINAERMMTEDQARIARIAREAEERARFGEEHRERMARQRERAERREREAFASGRLEATVVADTGLSWLVGEGVLREGAKTQEAVEGLLVRMVKGEGISTEVCDILERWRDWSDRGGMNAEDLAMLKNNKTGFCYAACVMGLLRETCTKDESSVAADMQECIRFWKKIRLG